MFLGSMQSLFLRPDLSIFRRRAQGRSGMAAGQSGEEVRDKRLKC